MQLLSWCIVDPADEGESKLGMYILGGQGRVRATGLGVFMEETQRFRICMLQRGVRAAKVLMSGQGYPWAEWEAVIEVSKARSCFGMRRKR